MNKLIQALVTTVTLVYAGASVASTLSIPNTFSSGATTSASDMNANFTAVKAAVDDNDTRITALEASSAPVFQGFSSGTVDGAGGIRGMQAACDASFSGSKICTSVEFSNSTYKQLSLSGSAWLLPVLQQTTGSSSSADEGFTTDQGSGYTSASDRPDRVFTCSAYSDTRQEGLTVSSTGGFDTESCGTARAVACCK